jgi:glucose/mannose transport system substrate-binding protein
VHWWTSGGESAAIRTVRRKLEAEGWTWQDTAIQGPDVAKTAAITRVLGGRPPTVMLWFVGQDLQELAHDGVIRDVQAVAAAGGWDDVLPAEISRRLKVEGQYVAVPADLHCGNWTFANAKLLERAGVALPDSWDAVLAACPKLAASGVIPIAFGGQKWQEASVFVLVLTGVGGPALLRRFVSEHDPEAAGGPEMVEAFTVFGKLRPFVDKASPNRSWSDSAALLATDRAAFYFSGDWARGDFNRAGMRPEIDYLCHAAPGNQGIFLAVVDAFCMPRTTDPAVMAAQDAFARAVMSPDVQHDFNLAKGSIPPRSDIPLAGYDACAEMAARLSRGGGQVLPAASMGMTTDMREAMYDVVHRFWSDPDASPKTAAAELRVAIERTRS